MTIILINQKQKSAATQNTHKICNNPTTIAKTNFCKGVAFDLLRANFTILTF